MLSPPWIILRAAFLMTLLSYSNGSVRLHISSPRHGAVFDIAALRANGGVNLEVSILVNVKSKNICEVNRRSFCLYVNGSTFTDSFDIASISSAHGLVVPSIAWQTGRVWLHISLFLLVWHNFLAKRGLN